MAVGGVLSMVAVVIIVLVVVGYAVSTRIHPLRKCSTCGMTGRHFGGIFKSSWRPCRNCSGTGRRDRVGTKVIWGGTGNTGFYPKK
jgi:hypothetical protein